MMNHHFNMPKDESNKLDSDIPEPKAERILTMYSAHYFQLKIETV